MLNSCFRTDFCIMLNFIDFSACLALQQRNLLTPLDKWYFFGIVDERERQNGANAYRSGA
ncbi:protein of unknown function [Aminobacter niigataensis]|nr:protein of unknown function [Aminobacter niigataensis]